MVNLFLSEPKWNDDAQKSSNINVILPLLNKLGSQIQLLVTHGARSEARLWLCSALSTISISPSKQLNIFMKLLRSKPRKMQFLSQVLTMMFEKRPRKLGFLLAKRSYILEKFFEGNQKRILEWFSEFAYDGGSDHKRGAKALAQFAFANRDICWEELEWRGIESWDSGDSSRWLGVLLSRYVDTESIDELLLLSSIINQGRQLLRLVRDENGNDEGELLKETMAEICRGLENESSFSVILRELSKMKHIQVIKLLGLLSWTIHFRLSEECQTPDSWELLFRENGIEFRRSSDHSLLSYNGFSEESESDSDSRSRVSKKRHKREKKKRKKKKKRAFDDDDDRGDDELLDLHSISRSWLLSTDGFSATWTSVDLPEYIAKYCLSTWMKGLLARQK
ncbi:hypothetical protein AtEden1_Chr5g0133911 [Arabidopsis thaliana]